MELALHNSLRNFYTTLGLDEVMPPADFEEGLVSLESELERVALDAYTATRQSVCFAKAVHDWDNYPYLARLHSALDDILTMSLPPTLERWITELLSSPEPPSFRETRRALVQEAASGVNPRLRALARFALFESVRLNIVLMARWYPDETFGVGLELQELDKIADEQVTEWLSQDPAAPEHTRPLLLIVVSALERLTIKSVDLRDALRGLQADVVAELKTRAAIEAALADMDVRDALLIRNYAAPYFGEQKLTIEHLQKRHFHVLGDVQRNTLDQRLRRALKKNGDALRRRRVALFDLLRNIGTAAYSSFQR